MTTDTTTHTLRDLGDGVWLDRAPVSFLGLRLTAETTILRLSDETLLVHAPGPLTEDRLGAVRALGAITHIYVPNLFHHMYAQQWADAIPDAVVHAPQEIATKQPNLRVDVRNNSAPIDAHLDEIAIDGCRLGESVLLHRPSRTLVVTDLISNIGRPDHAWTRAYTKFGKFYDRVALSRLLQWTSFSDRHVARRCVDRLLAEDFSRITVGHGDPVLADAREQLRDAYDFLVR